MHIFVARKRLRRILLYLKRVLSKVNIISNLKTNNLTQINKINNKLKYKVIKFSKTFKAILIIRTITTMATILILKQIEIRKIFLINFDYFFIITFFFIYLFICDNFKTRKKNKKEYCIYTNMRKT